MKITPKQYADMKGITLQAVTKMIREKGTLPDAQKIEKFGRFYLITIKKQK